MLYVLIPALDSDWLEGADSFYLTAMQLQISGLYQYHSYITQFVRTQHVMLNRAALTRHFLPRSTLESQFHKDTHRVQEVLDV